MITPYSQVFWPFFNMSIFLPIIRVCYCVRSYNSLESPHALHICLFFIISAAVLQ